jgi:hypothetical protein
MMSEELKDIYQNIPIYTGAPKENSPALAAYFAWIGFE